MKTIPCTSCGTLCDRGSRSGLCRACKFPPRPVRHCGGCGVEINFQNKGGLCKPCVCRRNHADPEMAERRRATLNASNANPAVWRKRAIACRKACRTKAERQRRSELGKRTCHRTIHSDKGRERAFTPEAIALRGAARSASAAERRLSKNEQRARATAKRAARRMAAAKRAAANAGLLVKAQQAADNAAMLETRRAERQLRKDQVKRVKAEQKAAAERAAWFAANAATLTPFERAMERVKMGAPIVEVRPFKTRADPSYTLGGVAG